MTTIKQKKQDEIPIESYYTKEEFFRLTRQLVKSEMGMIELIKLTNSHDIVIGYEYPAGQTEPNYEKPIVGYTAKGFDGLQEALAAVTGERIKKRLKRMESIIIRIERGENKGQAEIAKT